MAPIISNARLRARYYFVKVFQNLWHAKPRNAEVPKTISDRLARDVGLSRADIERARFEWPSDSHDRPLL